MITDCICYNCGRQHRRKNGSPRDLCLRCRKIAESDYSGGEGFCAQQKMVRPKTRGSYKKKHLQELSIVTQLSRQENN